ncbi:MAG: alanine--tRNA ligase [Candidatus Omnitrophica bacterium]|nr:alanine--tRNA ligase [Candidatus Omnitrophota bacterium]
MPKQPKRRLTRCSDTEMENSTGYIRQKFLEFFEKKGHRVVESDLLVPRNDPTLLFTGAGMNQFKEQFMGKNITYTRAASCQKCFRTGDLENVGKTPRHHTFFEMLGNFSFGDYFKEEAILWAWEFMTKEMRLDEDKLWVSVYKDDDEAYRIWADRVQLPPGRIVKMGEHDNFWPADAPSKGPNGPCGPCSEIFYDQGPDSGCGREECTPACGCNRFLEVWNLVFTQFERKPDGTLDPLPKKNIDTGMGLERMAAVMQKVRTNFDIDIFRPINEDVEKYMASPGKGGRKKEEDVHLIADHIRAITFAICDGVSPSNEKQGYVVRKLIRRAYLRSDRSGPFLYKIVPTVVRVMKDAYPELSEKREHISAIVEEEEKRFNETLDAATPILEDMLRARPEELSGEQIFKLVDTYGLPVDVIEQESDVSLDMQGFERLMEKRREQSRKGSYITEEFIFKPEKFKGVEKPESSDELPLETEVKFILLEEKAVKSVGEGERAEIVADPQSARFYPEGGGQVGDTGRIEKEGCDIKVLDTFEAEGMKVLVVFVKKGSLEKGDRVRLYLDTDKKQMTAINHTATHLLQAALRKVLGDQVKQSGSAVDEKRLRFDFTHMKKLSEREIEKVEELVNGWIQDGIQVSKETKQIKEAHAEGALSFFGEKYDDTVRVVTVGEHSKELCGGTHVDNTSEIGIFKIISESSVASGIRRIEAVTGDNAERWLKEELENFIREYRKAADGDAGLDKDIEKKAEGIASGRIKIDRDVIKLYEEEIKPAFTRAIERLEKAAKKKQKKKQAEAFDEAKDRADKLLTERVELPEGDLVCGVIPDVDMQVLRRVTAYLEKQTRSGIVLLGSAKGDKAFLICAVTQDMADKGYNAKDVVTAISGHISGGGGGKAVFAQAGGKDPEGLEKAVEEGKNIIKGT